MKIIQRFIPTSNKDTRPGIKMVPKYITIHETDNPSPGADAQAHAWLQERGNDRTASWHLQIDDQEAIQSIPFDEVAWAAGDGRNGTGNLKSIHIEICVNSDGDYKQAVQNTAEVTKQLLDQLNIPQSNVVQHNYWTGKKCPRNLRSGEKGISWNDFINMVMRAQSATALVRASEGPIPPYIPTDNGIIGRVRVIIDDLNIRVAPDPKAAITRKAVRGEVFDVYANINDWHNVGGANWVFGNNGQYLELVTDTSKPPYPGELIKEGSQGKDVGRIQQALGVTPDRIFGSKTKSAVIDFQRRQGLLVDGIVGPKTWSLLF